jgi:hypothetical protein
MSKTYRAILIDPEARSIRELQSDCSLDSSTSWSARKR